MSVHYDTIQGLVKEGNVEIKYWTEYVGDGKVMYFKVNRKELKAIKGLRRNKNYGYYTKRVVNPASTIKLLIQEYRD